MFMFAIVFGLSMDYEVFLLSRVREEYLRSGDNDAAIIDGIAGTARVITSAALIMISVFLGFVLGDDPATKMFGLGLATAIFIDATIVRMVLVPATMTSRRATGDSRWLGLRLRPMTSTDSPYRRCPRWRLSLPRTDRAPAEPRSVVALTSVRLDRPVPLPCAAPRAWLSAIPTSCGPP